MKLLKKFKKSYIVIISIIILFSLGIFLLLNNVEKEPQDLNNLYCDQNDAFANIFKEKEIDTISSIISNSTSSNILPNCSYKSYVSTGKNILYANLYFYEQDTGNILTLNEIEMYLSKEFEENGEIRIYNNGKHEKIQKYIEWYLSNKNLLNSKLSDLYTIYWDGISKLYPAEEPELAANFLDLPFNEFVKIIEKDKNPSYYLDIPYEVAFPK